MLFKNRKYWLMLLIMIGIICFVKHNYFLYKTAIVKVEKVKTVKTNIAYSEVSDKEQYYEQTLTVRVMNGNDKGKRLNIRNVCSYSAVDNERYKKGDDLFVSKSYGEITGVKRDWYVVLLAVVIISLLLIGAGRRGGLAIVSLALNIGIFIGAVKFHENTQTSLLRMCMVLSLLFVIATLMIINGPNRKTGAAILATLITSALSMAIFVGAMKLGEPIDYAALDYIVGNEDIEEIFMSGILMAGLGAIMDVCVSMAAAIGEILEKNINTDVKALIQSGRAVGHDIMGTMLSVLMFTYLGGLMPMLIIKMRNGESMITLFRLHIPFEVSRFLTGGIGILLAIPISLCVSIGFLKYRRKA